MKKLFALLLAALMVLGMCACDTTTSDDHDYNTPVTVPPIVDETDVRINTEF